MADLVIGAANTSNSVYSNSRSTVCTDSNTLYHFFIDDDSTFFHVYYYKSTDGGNTWGSKVKVGEDSRASSAFAIWYDRWTDASDTGSNIYICYENIDDGTSDPVRFRILDTSDDSLSSPVDVDTTGTSSSGDWNTTSITMGKTRSGNLAAMGYTHTGANGFMAVTVSA